MTIKFITGYSPYTSGDRAGFSPEKEKELVEEGVAKFVGGETKKEVKKPQVDKMVKNSKTKDKETYKCECGREFDTPQGLGAHKRFCEKAGD